MSDNPWPDFPKERRPRTVKRVLLEQGGGIVEKTEGDVQFYVETTSGGRDKFSHDCYLVVPRLNYRYHLLRVTHGLDQYPAEIVSDSFPEEVSVGNEAELIKNLRIIFHSERTRKVVEQLLDAVS
jgi:hypothetical protein